MRTIKRAFHRLSTLAGYSLLVPATWSSGADWNVKEAPVRFTLELEQAPTHKSAGYFVHLPDGGLLPTPAPLTHVVTKGGKPLASYALWHNRVGGLSLVFEDPEGENAVDVYVSPAKALKLWTPASDLTPSSILCADPTAGTMAAAVKLSKLGTVGPTVHCLDHVGIPKKAPLSIGGDLSGRPKPCAFYLLAHVESRDPGRTWVAPFVIDGQCQVHVNGTAIVPQKRTDKWGGVGQYVNLPKGLNRVEVFQSIGGQGSFSSHARKGGLMYLTWQTPNATMRELGGVRPKGVPMAGTSKMETRVLYDSEIAHSGHCKLATTRFQDGSPVPQIEIRPLEVFWLEGEAPVIIYELSAFTDGNPKDTTYTWDLGGNASLSRPKLLWWYGGGLEHSVTLTVSSGGKQRRSTKPFYGYAPLQSSLEDAGTRELFRKTALTVFEAYPGKADPTATWDASVWNNFFRTMELGKGQELLTHIFSVRWETLKAKLPPDKQEQLLDIFLDFVPRISPVKALQWVDRLEREAKGDRQQSELMKIMHAEIQMYYMGDLEGARKTLSDLLRARSMGEMAELARIRSGDLEFLKGNLNEATKIYGDVQNRVHHSRTRSGTGSSRLGAYRTKQTPEERRRDWLANAPRLARPGALPEKEDEPSKKDKSNQAQEAGPASTPTFHADANIRVEDWKLNALLDVSASENVKTLIDQGYLLEAKRGLQDWERESPLSKVSSDFILSEATLYMKLGDWARASVMLRPYCEQIDASSFFPAATEALLKCMIELGEPKDKVTTFYETVKKKLEFHPASEDLERLVNSL